MPSSLMKKTPLLLISLSLMLAITSCSFFFEEKKKVTEVAYNESMGSCVGQVNQTLKRYFNTSPEIQVIESELDAVTECYQESIESFLVHTKSGRAESDDYSSENIELLIGQFHKEIAMTADRIQTYVHLKSFLFGGSSETLSKNELKELQSLVPIFVGALKKLLPHLKVLQQSATLEANEESYLKIQQAFDELKRQSGVILKTLSDGSKTRKVNLEAFAKFFFAEIYGDQAATMEKYLPLIKAFKAFAVNEEGEDLHFKNLALFVRQSILTYEAMVHFEYMLRRDGVDSLFTNMGHLVTFMTRIPRQLLGGRIFETVSLKSLVDIVKSAEAVLMFSTQNRPNRELPVSHIENLLLGLEKAEIMKGNLSADTIAEFLSDFSEFWLNPGAPRATAINPKKVQHVARFFNVWLRRQNLVNQVFEGKGDGVVSLEAAFGGLDSPLATQLKKVLTSVNAHQWDDRLRLLFTEDKDHFSYGELTVANSIMTLAELFMKPFNLQQQNPLKYQVTQDQTQQIYEVIRTLGVELAFMDSRILDSGRRTFIEMNHFSTQNRSDGVLDFYEGYEYVAMSMSAGRLSNRIYEEIPESCSLEPVDVLNRNVTDVQCFRQHLEKNFLTYFEHLPNISKYWSQATEEEKDSFMSSVEVASRGGVIREKPVDMNEIRVVVSIISFVESIFFMFDRDNVNGLLDGRATGEGLSEIRLAEMHFRPLIVDFLMNKRSDILTNRKELFQKFCGEGMQGVELARCIAPKILIHLLKKGDLPVSSGQACGLLKFRAILDKNNEERAYLRAVATPGDVLKVFSAMAEMTHMSHVQRLQSFLLEKRTPLLKSLSSDTAPDCRAHPDNVFCEWRREIFCNRTVNQEVFDEFRYQKQKYFLSDDFENNPEAAVKRTLLKIYHDFDTHHRYSTHCAFPVVVPDRKVPIWHQFKEDCF